MSTYARRNYDGKYDIVQNGKVVRKNFSGLRVTAMAEAISIRNSGRRLPEVEPPNGRTVCGSHDEPSRKGWPYD